MDSIPHKSLPLPMTCVHRAREHLCHSRLARCQLYTAGRPRRPLPSAGHGLALVLVFIGSKMLLLDVYKDPVGIALAVTAAIVLHYRCWRRCGLPQRLPYGGLKTHAHRALVTTLSRGYWPSWTGHHFAGRSRGSTVMSYLPLRDSRLPVASPSACSADSFRGRFNVVHRAVFDAAGQCNGDGGWRRRST